MYESFACWILKLEYCERFKTNRRHTEEDIWQTQLDFTTTVQCAATSHTVKSNFDKSTENTFQYFYTTHEKKNRLVL